MKRILAIICALCLLLGTVSGLAGCGRKVEVKAKIGLLMTELSGENDEMLSGYQDSLNSRYETGEVEYIKKSADGDESKLQGLLQELVDEKVDAIVTFGDVASKVAVEQGLSIPVFFVGVTDAVGLGLTSSIENPDKNATGMEKVIAASTIVAQIAKLTDVSSYGILVDQSNAEANSAAASMQQALKDAGKSSDIVAVNAENAVAQATSAVAKYDALFITDCQEINGVIEDVIKTADAAKKPVFGYTHDQAEFGAVLTVSSALRSIGGMTGQSTYAFLSGTKINDIPVLVETPGNTTYVNHAKAVMLGYGLNDEFRNTAMIVSPVEEPATDAPAETEAE